MIIPNKGIEQSHKDLNDFNKFIGSYIDVQIRLTKGATERSSQYGIEGDLWFYEPTEHAEKTKMFFGL